MPSLHGTDERKSIRRLVRKWGRERTRGTLSACALGLLSRLESRLPSLHNRCTKPVQGSQRLPITVSLRLILYRPLVE